MLAFQLTSSGNSEVTAGREPALQGCMFAAEEAGSGDKIKSQYSCQK
jgi:hypothetical protein